MPELTSEALEADRAADFKVFGTNDPDEIRKKVKQWKTL
jgi:hypothetical protein